MCVNNKAPAALRTSRLSQLLNAVQRGFSLRRILRFAIRTKEPSDVAQRGLRMVHGCPMAHVSIGPRAVRRGALSLIKEGRAMRSMRRVFRLTHRLKLSGVGVSLVTKLPKRSTTSVRSALRGVRGLRPSDLAMRTLTVGHTTGFNRRKEAVSPKARVARVIRTTTTSTRHVKLIPCCLCHRGGVTKGFRGINCTRRSGTKICGVLVVRRHRAVVTYNTNSAAGLILPRGVGADDNGRAGLVHMRGIGGVVRCVSHVSRVVRQGGMLFRGGWG